jgi:hypothetical protein
MNGLPVTIYTGFNSWDISSNLHLQEILNKTNRD